MTCKNYLLVKWKISKLLPNTMSTDGKYSVLNWDNLKQPIQMQLSHKQKTFSAFFCGFLKSSWYFEHFQKRRTLKAQIFTILRTPKNMVRSISKRSSFKESLGKRHDKRAKTLSKFEWPHLYHIYWSLWRRLTCKKSLLVICKISNCFLTHWLPMASILFLIETI